jgi:hypothetical protein
VSGRVETFLDESEDEDLEVSQYLYPYDVGRRRGGVGTRGNGDDGTRMIRKVDQFCETKVEKG